MDISVTNEDRMWKLASTRIIKNTRVVYGVEYLQVLAAELSAVTLTNKVLRASVSNRRCSSSCCPHIQMYRTPNYEMISCTLRTSPLKLKLLVDSLYHDLGAATETLCP